MVVVLDVPARAEFVGLVRLVASSLASDRVVDEDRREDLKLAVSEACTNAVESYDVAEGKRVVVLCLEDALGVEVRVSDRGRGLGPDRLVGQLPMGTGPRLEAERGLGIPLMRALVDEVRFSSTHPGTTVSLLVHAGEAKTAGV